MSAAPDQRTILLRPDPEGLGFEVAICPPYVGIGHDRVLPDYRQARGYASGLKLCLGLPLVDRCDEALRG